MTLEERRTELDRRHRELVAAETSMRENVQTLHDQVQQLRGAISILDQLIGEQPPQRGNGPMPAADIARAESLIAGKEDSDG